jgi:uncharacterized phiE125 gp8 family phage protein
MALKLLTPPATYPVTLAEAKAQCRIDGNDDDTYLTALIAAATDYVQEYTGRSLVAQTWELHLDAFSCSIRLARGPVSSVSSVQYYDDDDVLQTIDIANYSVDLVSEPQWIVPVSGYSWPTPATGINNVLITFVAGYSTIPDAIRLAILLLIATWYDQRAGTSDKPITETPHAVAALLANYRLYAF